MMPSSSTSEQYTLTLPSDWTPPSFLFNQYVGWALNEDGFHGTGWVVGINRDVESLPRSDGYFYSVVVDSGSKCYQEWAILNEDLTPVLETFYSYQLKAL